MRGRDDDIQAGLADMPSSSPISFVPQYPNPSAQARSGSLNRKRNKRIEKNKKKKKR